MGRGAPTGTGAFNVDLTEATKLAEHLRGPKVKKIIGDEMVNAGQRSGRKARDAANRNITNKSGKSTGRLAKSGKVESTVRAGLTFETDVIWNAKSDGGFGYAYVHDKGRGPVFAKPGGWLRFEAYGSVFFRKSVGPAAGSNFTGKGLDQSMATIQAEHDKAGREIGRRVEALQ